MAAAFLMLYAFVATPVQLWHHHDAAQQNKTAEAKISKPSTDNTNAGDCKICQHTYASYLHEDSSLAFETTSFPSIKNPSLKSGNSIICPDTISNKGPPLV